MATTDETATIESGNLPRLTSLSFSHPEVTADHRGPLSLVGDSLRSAHRRLRFQGRDAFILSTCLRVELAWDGEPDEAPDLLKTLWGRHSPVGIGTVRQDGAAFLHLCRIAAGLDSPLVGEAEVLGQFRQAVAMQREESSGAGRLGRILDAAIGIGRATRRILPEPIRGSLAAAAAEQAAPLGRVAVLGAGAMARAAVDNLRGTQVTVFARRPGVVGGHEIAAWESAPKALATYPAVLSTVPGKTALFGPGIVAAALARRDDPVLIVDLGMPPGFDRPAPGGPVSYVGLDEVAASVDNRPAIAAERETADEADATWRRLTAPARAGAVIAAMVGRAEEAVAEEVRRFAPRLEVAADPEEVLRQVAHTVARRLLHSPISYLNGSDPAAVDVVAAAFGVDGVDSD